MGKIAQSVLSLLHRVEGMHGLQREKSDEIQQKNFIVFYEVVSSNNIYKIDKKKKLCSFYSFFKSYEGFFLCSVKCFAFLRFSFLTSYFDTIIQQLYRRRVPQYLRLFCSPLDTRGRQVKETVVKGREGN